MLTAMFHLASFFMLKTSYDGIVVARLPFVPFTFLHKITHRNLEGDDMAECSFIFIYMLCSMSIKPNLQKLLGFEPPAAQNMSYDAASKMAERLTGISSDK